MKPIAGPNTMPFGLGGFCVTGAKINGVKYKSLNIYQQRSGNLFDLIDGYGITHDYIQLVHVDSKQQLLDATASTDDLLDIIPDNSFFIKTQDPNTLKPIFVFQYQSNIIKLSNGVMSFKPWSYVNYCNAIDENSQISPSLSMLTASPTTVPADGVEFSTITLTILDEQGNPIPGIKSSDVKFEVTGFDLDEVYRINSFDDSQSAQGIITAHIEAVEQVTATITAIVKGITIDQTAQVTFSGGGSSQIVDVNLSSVTATSPIVADGTSVSTITIKLVDSNNGPIKNLRAFIDILISGFSSADKHTLSEVDSSQSNLGIYTATLSATELATVSLTVYAGATKLTDQPKIEFIGTNEISPALSSVVCSRYVVEDIFYYGYEATVDNNPLIITMAFVDKFSNPVNLSSGVGLSLSGEWDESKYKFGDVDYTRSAEGIYTVKAESFLEAANIRVYPTINGVEYLMMQSDPISLRYTNREGISTNNIASSGIWLVKNANPSVKFVADGESSCEFTILVCEQNYADPSSKVVNNVKKTELSLSVTDPGISVIPNTTIDSSGAGIFKFDITSTKATALSIRAEITTQDDNVIYSTTERIEFVSGPAVASNSIFTSTPATGTVDSTITQTVKLRDKFDNPTTDVGFLFVSAGNGDYYKTDVVSGQRDDERFSTFKISMPMIITSTAMLDRELIGTETTRINDSAGNTGNPSAWPDSSSVITINPSHISNNNKESAKVDMKFYYKGERCVGIEPSMVAVREVFRENGNGFTISAIEKSDSPEPWGQFNAYIKSHVPGNYEFVVDVYAGNVHEPEFLKYTSGELNLTVDYDFWPDANNSVLEHDDYLINNNPIGSFGTATFKLYTRDQFDDIFYMDPSYGLSFFDDGTGTFSEIDYSNAEDGYVTCTYTNKNYGDHNVGCKLLNTNISSSIQVVDGSIVDANTTTVEVNNPLLINEDHTVVITPRNAYGGIILDKPLFLHNASNPTDWEMYWVYENNIYYMTVISTVVQDVEFQIALNDVRITQLVELNFVSEINT